MSVSADREELFRLRVERRRRDLLEALEMLYGPETAPRLAERLVELAHEAYLDRPHDLHILDLKRSLQPDWLQLPEMVGYAAYADRFAVNLKGVEDKIPYLRELGVTYLHLMPLLEPRSGDNDGGYAVRDYRRVRADLGSIDDLQHLATTLRENGMSLVLDLVLNHVAREHEWAIRARDGEQRYRDYFYVYPDREQPDAYERTLPEVFPDFAPGSFSWDEDLQGWVWTTFNAFQWDLNWTNPDVLIEFTELILWLANLGVEVLRLDAIAFLWKRLGTTCQNEPEVHAITQVLRTVARIACPALAFKAEAIVAPHDLVQYLGAGPHYGKVSDLAYHNTLMVQIWSALATADSRLAAHTLEGLPRAPSTSGWITYVRCHDDIGWAITDEDAGALGLSGYHHRRFLSDWYSGSFPGSPARGLVFQENAETGDRRISGMTSALVGLSAAREPEEVDAALGRYFLTHAIVYGWGGIPVIWSGDEIGMSNDLEWANEPGHETDNRWAHRPRLDWRRAEQRHDLRTVPGRIFAGLQHLTRVRATFPQLHASVRSEVLWVDDGGVLATVRRAPIGPMVCLYNVTPELRSFPAWRVAEIGIHDPWDAISGRPVEPDADGFFWMTPYAAWWLGERDDHMSEGAKPMSAEASALLSGGAGREAVGSQRRGAPMASRAEATGARSTLVRTSYSIGRVWTLPSSGRAQSSRPVLTQVGLQRRGGWPWPSPSTAIATCCCSPPS